MKVYNNIEVQGNVFAKQFVTNNGTISQVVTGEGVLQPASSVIPLGTYKNGNVTVSTSGFTVTAGVCIYVTMPSLTANMKINVNNTGAKEVRYRGLTNFSGLTLADNITRLLRFDGKVWNIIGDVPTIIPDATDTVTGVIRAEDHKKLTDAYGYIKEDENFKKPLVLTDDFITQEMGLSGSTVMLAEIIDCLLFDFYDGDFGMVNGKEWPKEMVIQTVPTRVYLTDVSDILEMLCNNYVMSRVNFREGEKYRVHFLNTFQGNAGNFLVQDAGQHVFGNDIFAGQDWIFEYSFFQPLPDMWTLSYDYKQNKVRLP